ncbi:MAG: hypothetical protein FWE76_02815 [Symbiobacteriaceae bacterium]|nr:hypothetical protein [Symbiobacteriaceae bacterium]
MEVIGLIGSSGTGKSHRAVTLARELQVTAIIDDGLLISGNRILAGRSAKAEQSRMAAVRRAIFEDGVHAEEVRQELGRLMPEKLLILGTSRAMIKRICDALLLTPPERVIDIGDLASEEEMQLARNQRHDQGTHVIPVTHTEVRRKIPVTLTDVLDSMRRSSKEERILERTQVKPPFASDSGLAFQLPMVQPLIERVISEGGSPFYRLNNASLQQKHSLTLVLDLASTVEGLDLLLLQGIQDLVTERIRAATGRTISSVELYISSLM